MMYFAQILKLTIAIAEYVSFYCCNIINNYVTRSRSCTVVQWVKRVTGNQTFMGSILLGTRKVFLLRKRRLSQHEHFFYSYSKLKIFIKLLIY